MRTTLLRGMALVMALMLVFAQAALAAPGDVSLFNDAEQPEYVQAMTAYEGKLYALTDKGLYQYESGAETPTLIAPMPELSQAESETPGITAMAAGPDGLYGLDSNTGRLFTLSWSTGMLELTPVIDLDWANMTQILDGGYPYPRLRGGFVIERDALYALRTEDDYMTARLMRFDLTTGKGERVSDELFDSLCAYKPGSLLATGRKEMDYENPLTLNAIDTASGAVTPLMTLRGPNDSGLAYDEKTDTIYYLSNGEVVASKALAEGETVAYLPIQNNWGGGNNAAFLDGGYYAQYTGDALILRNVDPAHKPERALRIGGLYADEVVRAFMKDHPEIPVVLDTSDYYDMEKLTNNMKSGASAMDLYMISVAYQSFETLRDKGYAGDLSQSEVLKRIISEMYLDIAEIFSRDGKLHGLPQSISAYGLGYSERVLKDIGLTEVDLPTNYIELFEFIARWENEFAAQFPDYSLFENQEELELQGMLMGNLFTDYNAYLADQGKPLEYDTELFKKLLTALEATDFSGFKQRDPEEDQSSRSAFVTVVAAGGEDEGPKALFNTYANATLSQYGAYMGDYKILPLSLDADTPKLINTELEAFMLNPDSQNADLAIQFLEYYAEHMSDDLKINLMPNENAPLRNPDYDRMLSEYTTRRDELKKSIDSAKDGENTSALEQELRDMEQSIEWISGLEWLITEEDIQDYRALHELMRINRGNLFYRAGGDQSQELQTLITRYTDGQMPADQFARELDKKVRMMEMEGN